MKQIGRLPGSLGNMSTLGLAVYDRQGCIKSWSTFATFFNCAADSCFKNQVNNAWQSKPVTAQKM